MWCVLLSTVISRPRLIRASQTLFHSSICTEEAGVCWPNVVQMPLSPALSSRADTSELT